MSDLPKFTLHFHGACKQMHRGGGALMILEHLKLLGKLDYEVKGGPYDPDSGFGEVQTKIARCAAPGLSSCVWALHAGWCLGFMVF